MTSFRNLLLVRAGAGLAAAVGAAGAAAGGGGGVMGGHHAAATLLANNALAAAAVVAHQLQSFTQKPSNAIVNMRLHNQLQSQRIANAILTNTAPNR